MAGAAVGAAAAAGGFAGPPVADHAAHNETEHRRDREDQHEIDKICREPREHEITSFPGVCGGIGLPDTAAEEEKEETGVNYLTVSFCGSL